MAHPANLREWGSIWSRTLFDAHKILLGNYRLSDHMVNSYMISCFFAQEPMPGATHHLAPSIGGNRTTNPTMDATMGTNANPTTGTSGWCQACGPTTPTSHLDSPTLSMGAPVETEMDTRGYPDPAPLTQDFEAGVNFEDDFNPLLSDYRSCLDGQTVYLVYHGGCPDGCLAASIMRRSLSL